MGTTSSITMQSLGKIAQCAPAVGAKMWCLYVCLFFTGQKSGFSPPQGPLVAPIQAKLVMADGHLGYAKFHLNRRRGGNAAPKMSKISTFW